jgi:hypothetical protein
MTRQSTLPSSREQVRHALLLLGAPAPARLVLDVHAALFDGDLDMPSLVALVRAEQRGTGEAAGSSGAYKICVGLEVDLTAARGVLALDAWPLERRILTPATARADALAMVVRVADFIGMRPAVDASVLRLMRQLAESVPGGPEAVDVLAPGALAEAARLALAEPALAAAVDRERSARAAAVARAERLDLGLQLFGVPAMPRQRGHE